MQTQHYTQHMLQLQMQMQQLPLHTTRYSSATSPASLCLAVLAWLCLATRSQVVQAKMGNGFYRKQGSMKNNSMTF